MARLTLTSEQLEKATAAHYGYDYDDWAALDERHKRTCRERMKTAFYVVDIELGDD